MNIQMNNQSIIHLISINLIANRLFFQISIVTFRNEWTLNDGHFSYRPKSIIIWNILCFLELSISNALIDCLYRRPIV